VDSKKEPQGVFGSGNCGQGFVILLFREKTGERPKALVMGGIKGIRYIETTDRRVARRRKRGKVWSVLL